MHPKLISDMDVFPRSLVLLSGLRQIATYMAVAPKLSFVPFNERSGKIRWEKQKW